MIRRPPRSPLLPYPTLFRSTAERQHLPLAAGQRPRCLTAALGQSREAGQNGFDALRERWGGPQAPERPAQDRKSTRLNSSHANISYAVFCLKKKNFSLTNNS